VRLAHQKIGFHIPYNYASMVYDEVYRKYISARKSPLLLEFILLHAVTISLVFEYRFEFSS